MKKEIKKNEEIVVNYVRNLKKQGAVMTESIAGQKNEVPPTAGIFSENWPEWVADGEIAPEKSLWRYKGVGYQARTEIQKIENYSPEKAPNNYAVRPRPDEYGVFPFVKNMDVSLGMFVRGSEGVVYACYANPVTSLQWEPKDLPSSFKPVKMG